MRKILKYLFLLFPVILNAQEWAFQYEFSYAIYQLKDIKAIQVKLVSSMSIYEAKSTE